MAARSKERTGSCIKVKVDVFAEKLDGRDDDWSREAGGVDAQGFNVAS
jgi:hypothetical protein